MEEIWKDIKGYEGIYQISNLGRVKSSERRGNGREIILKGWKPKDGYKRVKLIKKYKVENKLIHRLIAEAFIPNPNNYPVVNHKNGIKTDNQIENLEWCTQKYNMREAQRLNLLNPGKNIKEKRKVKQYTKEGKFIEEWSSMIEVQRKLGYKTSAISMCCKGKIKTAYGYIWKYAELGRD